MAWREKLYERPLKRPRGQSHHGGHTLRVPAPQARDSGPVRAAGKPGQARDDNQDEMAVVHRPVHQGDDAGRRRLSLAAKVLATNENRKVAVQFIDSIANDLNL